MIMKRTNIANDSFHGVAAIEPGTAHEFRGDLDACLDVLRDNCLTRQDVADQLDGGRKTMIVIETNHIVEREPGNR